MMQNSGKYPSSPRKISPSQFNMKQNSVEEPDPGQLLNEWLGELDNLQKVNSDLEKEILNSQFWTSIVLSTKKGFESRFFENLIGIFQHGGYVFSRYSKHI